TAQTPEQTQTQRYADRYDEAEAVGAVAYDALGSPEAPSVLQASEPACCEPHQEWRYRQPGPARRAIGHRELEGGDGGGDCGQPGRDGLDRDAGHGEALQVHRRVRETQDQREAQRAAD